MDLPAGRVIIELAPQFAPRHVANIQTFAHEHFWDGTSIYRSQDNFVVQFGDADADDAAKAKPFGSAARKLPAEFERASAGLKVSVLPDRDGWPRRPVSSTASRSARTRRPARPGWRTATACWARAAATKRTAASAPNCTW